FKATIDNLINDKQIEEMLRGLENTDIDTCTYLTSKDPACFLNEHILSDSDEKNKVLVHLLKKYWCIIILGMLSPSTSSSQTVSSIRWSTYTISDANKYKAHIRQHIVQMYTLLSNTYNYKSDVFYKLDYLLSFLTYTNKNNANIVHARLLSILKHKTGMAEDTLISMEASSDWTVQSIYNSPEMQQYHNLQDCIESLLNTVLLDSSLASQKDAENSKTVQLLLGIIEHYDEIVDVELAVPMYMRDSSKIDMYNKYKHLVEECMLCTNLTQFGQKIDTAYDSLLNEYRRKKGILQKYLQKQQKQQQQPQGLLVPELMRSDNDTGYYDNHYNVPVYDSTILDNDHRLARIIQTIDGLENITNQPNYKTQVSDSSKACPQLQDRFYTSALFYSQQRPEPEAGLFAASRQHKRRNSIILVVAIIGCLVAACLFKLYVIDGGHSSLLH
ncbi:hypothetical protein ENBRE01_3050, partial [Enteropsectra breve]